MGISISPTKSYTFSGGSEDSPVLRFPFSGGHVSGDWSCHVAIGAVDWTRDGFEFGQTFRFPISLDSSWLAKFLVGLRAFRVLALALPAWLPTFATNLSRPKPTFNLSIFYPRASPSPAALAGRTGEMGSTKKNSV